MPTIDDVFPPEQCSPEPERAAGRRAALTEIGDPDTVTGNPRVE